MSGRDYFLWILNAYRLWYSDYDSFIVRHIEADIYIKRIHNTRDDLQLTVRDSCGADYIQCHYLPDATIWIDVILIFGSLL